MLTLSLSVDKTLTIESPGVTLRRAQPLLNGSPLEGWSCEIIRSDGERIETRYTSASLSGGAFGLKAVHEDTRDRIWIQYWVEGLPQDLILDSFGLRFEQTENLRQYLRNGYFSWDGSYYVQPEAMTDFSEDEPRPETGYAMTQLLPRHGSGGLILGFDRHDRFQQTFTFDTRRQSVSLTIQTWWDRKDRSGLARCESERLAVFGHAGPEAGLRERFSDLSEEEIKSLAIYAGMSGGVTMTRDHLGELSPHRLRLWRLILPETRVSCDFPLLGRSNISYERLPADVGSNRARHVPKADDPLLVQVRHPIHEGTLGAIFFLNTGSHTVQRSYSLPELGIKDSVYLYRWEDGSASEQVAARITLTLAGHHSALYFFGRESIREAPVRLPL